MKEQHLPIHRILHFGDNLGVLQAMPPNSVALCCTDPPFNSGRNYNIFLSADAQETAFKDIWHWDDNAIETRDFIEAQASNNVAGYREAYRFLQGFDMTWGSPTHGGMASMRSYLTFMAPRIVEIHRVLKNDGSFYLHCDPTASHYLKALCDCIFGLKQFRNEIVWCYRKWTNASRYYQRNHDIILFYAKTHEYLFNKQFDANTPQAVKYERGWDTNRVSGIGRQLIVYNEEKARAEINSDKYDRVVYRLDTKGAALADWWEIPPLGSRAKERLGYPTQKPVALYERMIKASSNPGDVVLDPFCGCGTTIDAAEMLERSWIGIDITVLALKPIEKRLRERHGLEPHTDYEMKGYPCNMQEIELMLEDSRNSQRYKDFEVWAVTRLDMHPTRYLGDGGIDGWKTLKVWHQETQTLEEITAVCQVKSGNVSRSDVAAFHTDMQHAAARLGLVHEAKFGVLISTKPATAGVKEEMRLAGKIEHNGELYDRIAYWHIDEAYFTDNLPRLRIPGLAVRDAQRSERHYDDIQGEIPLSS